MLRVAKLNIDDNPITAARFNVRSIPTLLLLRNGREIDRIVGAQPKAEIVRRLQHAIGKPATSWTNSARTRKIRHTAPLCLRWSRRSGKWMRWRVIHSLAPRQSIPAETARSNQDGAAARER